MEPLEKIQPISSVVNQPHQFSYENGIYVTKVEPGRAEGVLEVGPDSINPHGMVHGGALATLADTVGGSCACATGRRCVTASSSMEFLRPASGKRITCIAIRNPPRNGSTAYCPSRHHGDTLFLLQRAMRIILSLHPVLQQNGADVFSLQKERGPLLGLFMMKYFKLDLYDIL